MEPILPQPIRPSVLPVSSTPMKRFFSHLPALVEAEASGICRASANIMAMACSAVVMVLPCGVFITTTPRAVAERMSTLSTPMPARPTTLRLVAGVEQFARHLGGGADREPVVRRDDGAQLGGRQAGLQVHVDAAAAEDVHRGGRELVADQDFGHEVARWSWPLPPSRKGRGSIPAILPSPCGRGRGRGAGYSAACAAACSAATTSCAQSSQGSSASISAVSTVAPPQMRRPGGASR